ncbi:YebC/PmpR family DNA-binding transcriptional regulator [Campylobacter canadensis]|uniref:Probable transcriptional regulatory protein AVCANL283_06980 n=1 Tax=Campylobacter canadensis TaxID=449520 RepID=A0ABS7WST4_9BACT|nr:YebC/PmpR family DNA-binding transcriptional regulator [Campylobacter canadensis]MBZ7987835.1 YebC/PmpR family DNA-binding transcriptional regulator [Campylobacter canadensis]MBZ7995208.1 YebC/PmpR family DNA-binding transcriptional regulator [Campylobacter canadensis]MBZ7997227.1 YebC/PmpR family DNA-binding transcriptional regulator [Campylobacter canadensis]MBZ7998844.1 YebC/PmpR family DNA-binding transcriptional regulator [Campylobacter canadensis]MBZ8000774.1 YebC/PmpR family DNA-bind
MGRAFEYRRAAKEARWDKMSKVFPKLAKAIEVAAKEGGCDPLMNAKLRSAIATAKAQNMPKDNIDAAIKRAAGKDGNDIKSLHYEAKANYGVQIIVEVATDNTNRTAANIKAIFNKNGATPLVNGSLDFIFSRKSVFVCKNNNLDTDELELFLIDFGLEELSIEEDNTIRIIGAYDSFKELNEGIEKQGLELVSGRLEYVANNPIELSEEQILELEKLLDKLEDDDDVQAVYTNIE